MRPRPLLAALAVFLAFASLVAAIPGAWAHAVLLESSPPDGARLEQPPPEIVLRFNEPVRPIAVRLLGPGGVPVASAAKPAAGGDTIRIAPSGELPPGAYVVSYRVTSIDGHPVSGSVIFGIGADAAAGPPDGALPDEGLLAAASAVTRAMLYGALLAATGGALFVLFVIGIAHTLRDQLRGGIRAMTVVALAAFVLSVGIGGAQVAGLAAGSLLTVEPWVIGTRTSLLTSAAAGIAGLLISGIGLGLGRPRLARTVTGIGVLLALVSLVLTGHATTAPPRMLSMPAVYLHGGAAAFWVGSLWPLATVLRHAPPAEAYRLVKRFSVIAAAAVVLLLASGLVLSIVQLGSLQAIASTAYGQIWAVKIGLALLLLGLAAINRQVLTRRLADLSVNGATALRRSIAVEMALVAGIVTVTALLGQTPPPRALEMRDHAGHGLGHSEPAVELEVKAQGSTARLRIAPGHPGPNRVTVTLLDNRGQPFEAQELVTAWSLRQADIEPFERPLAPAGKGQFAGLVELPAAGRWSVRIEALVSDFEKVIFRAEMDLPK